MRHGLFAVAVMLLATAAAAQPKEKDEGDDEKGKKGEEGEDGEKKEGGGAGMMDQTAPDPAESEGADRPEKKKVKRKVIVKSGAEVKVDADADEAFVLPRKPLHVFGEVLIGLGGTPLPGPDTEPDGSLFTIRVGGSYDFSKSFTLGLVFPWTTGTIETEGGSGSGPVSRNAQAIGAPLITAEIRSSLGTHTTLPWGLSVGIPIASGNPDFAGTDTPAITQFLMNAMADANSGWRDGELFASKRMPVVPFIGIVHEKDRLELHGLLKFAFLFNTGGEIVQPNITGGSLEMNGTALRTVIGVGGKYWFLKQPKLFAGLDLWTVYNTIRPIDYNSSTVSPEDTGGGDPNPLQWVIEPRVGARFGAVVLSVGYVRPLGGPLGEADAQGVRIGALANF